jgi:hypothetical protein
VERICNTVYANLFFFQEKKKILKGKKRHSWMISVVNFHTGANPTRVPLLSLLLLFPKWSPSMATTLMIDDGNQVSRWKRKKTSRVLYRIKVRRHIPRLFRFLSSPGEVDQQVTERSTTRGSPN